MKFLDKEQNENRPKTPIRYCQVVRDSALSGKTININRDDLSCPNAEITLGFVEPMYMDVESRVKPAATKAVRVGPLEDADVILLIANPKQAMDLATLLGGLDAHSQGLFAVCGEATANTYMKKKANATFLCSGARMFGGYSDNEMVVALTPDEAKRIADKIINLQKTCSALCGCKVSDLPPQVVESFRKIGFEKGTDYFFGKADGNDVRVYLGKDESARLKYITLLLPFKGDFTVEGPFLVNKRGNWSEIYGFYEIEQLSINLYTGKDLAKAIEDIVKKIIASKRPAGG